MKCVSMAEAQAAGIAPRTAQLYGQVAKDWGKIQPLIAQREALSLRAAVEAIVQPKPRPKRMFYKADLDRVHPDDLGLVLESVRDRAAVVTIKIRPVDQMSDPRQLVLPFD